MRRRLVATNEPKDFATKTLLGDEQNSTYHGELVVGFCALATSNLGSLFVRFFS
jgi:hypothetical protein